MVLWLTYGLINSQFVGAGQPPRMCENEIGAWWYNSGCNLISFTGCFKVMCLSLLGFKKLYSLLKIEGLGSVSGLQMGNTGTRLENNAELNKKYNRIKIL